MDIPAVLALARSLMEQHGVGDWGLALDRARRRAGLTDHARHRITLSRALMSLYDESGPAHPARGRPRLSESRVERPSANECPCALYL